MIYSKFLVLENQLRKILSEILITKWECKDILAALPLRVYVYPFLYAPVVLMVRFD